MASSSAAPKVLNPTDVVFPCNAPKIPLAQKRVRRAFHALSREERDKVYAAMWVLHDTPTWVGRELYGSIYLDWSDLVVRHAVAVVHPEGDSAHPQTFNRGVAFGAWHRAFGLLYENILRAVDPSIEAIPYWDAVGETHGFSMFTPDEWGTVPGNGPRGEVFNGRFAHWTIAPYDAERASLAHRTTPRQLSSEGRPAGSGLLPPAQLLDACSLSLSLWQDTRGTLTELLERQRALCGTSPRIRAASVQTSSHHMSFA